MEMVALITLCIGSALGLRFRVFVLLPAILVTIVLTVFVIDITTGWLRGRLFGKEARA